MEKILWGAILLSLVMTVGSLVGGLYAMFTGKKSGKSNKYMQMRVVFQFIAVAIVAMIVLVFNR